jgi:hypothetical protein
MDVWWIDEPAVLGSCNPSTEALEALRLEGFKVVVASFRRFVPIDAFEYRLGRVQTSSVMLG